MSTTFQLISIKLIAAVLSLLWLAALLPCLSTGTWGWYRDSMVLFFVCALASAGVIATRRAGAAARATGTAGFITGIGWLLLAMLGRDGWPIHFAAAIAAMGLASWAVGTALLQASPGHGARTTDRAVALVAVGATGVVPIILIKFFPYGMTTALMCLLATIVTVIDLRRLQRANPRPSEM